jgi:hypothetical protein
MLGQWIKLFIMFQSSLMQSFNIFGPREGSVFEFQIQAVLKIGENWKRVGPQVNSPLSFSTGCPGTRSRSRLPNGWSPLVTTPIARWGHRGGHRRSSPPTWIEGLIATRGRAEETFSHFISSMHSRPPHPTLLRVVTTIQTDIASCHHFSSSPFMPGKRSVVFASPSSTGFWPKSPTNDAGQPHSSCHHLPT